MRTNSPSTWRWAPADNNGSHTTWKSLADSECRLLDHAYQESWDRLELDIDGRPHVIDPFSSNAHIHVAVPLGNEGGPGALLARAMSVSIEGQRCTLPAHGLRSDRPSRWFPVSLREDAESEQKILRQPSLQQNYIGSPCESSADAAGVRHTSRRTISVSSTDSDGFQLVRRGRRERLLTSQTTLPTRRSANSSHIAKWRAFPKVDLEACDNYHVVRQVLVDGVDVALHHGGRRRLSPAGIAIAVAHFAELSFPVRVVVPQWVALMHEQHCNLFTESPEALLKALKEDDLLVVLPDPGEPIWSPRISRLKAESDAECTVELCKTFNAAYCSNDFNQFLQLLDGSPSRYNDYLYMSARSCLFAFDGDNFYHILDSLGRGKFVDKLFFRNKTT